MGIKLDWEVESEGGWSEIDEDAVAVASRQRRARQWRNIALAGLLVGLVVAGIIGWRLSSVSRQIRENLETTIHAETTALRMSDRERFLGIQSSVGSWRRIQEQTFDEYQVLDLSVEVTGEIIDIDIRADQARVTLKERVDGQDYQVNWFYEYYDGIWKHVAPNPDFWGASATLSTIHFEFIYREEDQPLVDNLKRQLNEWWEIACRATTCAEFPPQIQVRIEPDPLAKLDWSLYNEWTLIVPSPSLERVPLDNHVNPVLIENLADTLAMRWVDYLLLQYLGAEETIPPYSDVAWMRSELAVWLRESFTQPEQTASFFGVIVDHYGAEAIPAMLAQTPYLVNDQISAPLALEKITAEPAIDLPVTWDSYLEFRLNGEANLMSRGDETEAALIYRDTERFADLKFLNQPTEPTALPGSIQIIETYLFGEVVWARISYVDSGDTPVGIALLQTYEPFRLVGGRWVHTWPSLSDWGSPLQEQTPHVHLGYYELDAPLVAGLPAHLEQLYQQAAADLQIDQAGLQIVNLNVTPYATTNAITVIRSPHVAVWNGEISAADYLRQASARGIVTALVEGQSPLPNRAIVHALASYELAALGYPEERIFTLAQLDPASLVAPQSMEDIWGDQADHFGDQLAAALLLEQLVAANGDAIVPILLRNLGQAQDPYQWLSMSSAQFDEAAWLEAVAQEFAKRR